MGSALPAQPISFQPLGLYDALEGDSAPPGACTMLQNLVHDITTPFIWTGRPAAVLKTAFTGFPSPGVVSVMLSVGTRVYGMIGTSQYPGCDVPFCFDVLLGTFVPVSGTSSTNVPTSPPTIGDWTPPTMALIGTKIIVTHSGFSGSGSNFFGVIDLSTFATPAWTTANTTTNALPSVPTAVFQFDNRAWFACANVVYYSDSLDPVTITLSTQFLTIGGKGSNVVGFGGLPLQQTQGGILAALIIFKQLGFWQVAPSGSTYTLNGPTSPGTLAPRSVAQTPAGLAYMANDGVHIIGFDGTAPAVPLPGVRSPFQLAFYPSRVNACYNNSVYRIALQTITNALSGANGFADYWYDFEINQWSGPHTFASDMVVAVQSTFICATNRAAGALYQADSDITASTSVVELGASMPFTMQSVMLPDDDGMSMKSIIESQMNISFGAATNSLTVQLVSATQGIAGTAMISSITGTYWNQFNWNQANWSTTQYGLRVYNVDWSAPVVYKTGAISIFGSLNKGLRLGPFRLRVEPLEYMNDQNPA